jgi:hypothetical protein
MQNSPVTTAVHHNEVEVSLDWAAEAEALAQRVTSKIRPKTPLPQAVVPDEYEPQDIEQRKPSSRLTKC